MAALNSGVTGSTTLSSDEFRAGHLFWMPAGSTWFNRDKPRPFVLVAPCSETRVGTLAYGSSQQTEMRFGAACIAVDPVRTGLHRNRLSTRTYFYPGALLPARYVALPPHAGFLGRALDELRRVLRFALGIGQGSCLLPSSPKGSRRGRIVELNALLAPGVRTEFAVVLTEHGYSAETNYQIILPIYGAAGLPLGTHDLLVSSRDWLSVFPSHTKQALVPIPATHSVWYHHGIGRETEHVVDEETLAEVDRALCAYFSLPLPEQGERG
jgi:hypothetical protein